ncbi:H-type small acid-soluble spore protein [Alkalihalobacillus sp. CinArs1]|uniref:H-type small acid-soluble spore protein n=1 Tax=Alkalihalobacillus sp. CinArs1 TaxID=2995314 RepID=UPI0022DE7022|nr:H-type small acid-soluble spore protein [Alkalihalobacillus sp. CinArs1]
MRAKQILASKEEIQVLHNGNPVWLTSVNEQKETARIHETDRPDHEHDVSLYQLFEQ